MGNFDDIFDDSDFMIDPDDLYPRESEGDWDTGIEPDVFASGEKQDLFSTKDI